MDDPSNSLVVKPDWTPLDNLSGRQFLDFLLWKGAQHLASLWHKQDELTPAEGLAISVDDPQRSDLAIVHIFENNPRRREELYTVIAQTLDGMGSMISEATMRLFVQVRQEQVYLLEGWAGVTGWALSLRSGRNQSSGFWWQLGSIVDFVMPFVEKFIPNIPPSRFFDLAYLYKVAIVLPNLVRIIRADDDRGLPYNIMAVEAMLNEADAKTKSALQESHVNPRIPPVPAYFDNRGDEYRLVIVAQDQPTLDRVVRRLRGYVAITLDSSEVLE